MSAWKGNEESWIQFLIVPHCLAPWPSNLIFYQSLDLSESSHSSLKIHLNLNFSLAVFYFFYFCFLWLLNWKITTVRFYSIKWVLQSKDVPNGIVFLIETDKKATIKECLKGLLTHIYKLFLWVCSEMRQTLNQIHSHLNPNSCIYYLYGSGNWLNSPVVCSLLNSK